MVDTAPAPNWSGAFAGTFPALKVALATAMLTVALPRRRKYWR